MISLTQAAVAEIRQAAAQNGADNMALRIAARINEEGMLEFGMGFDEERGNDAIIDSWGLTVLVNAQSAPLLQDVTLDFGEVSPGQMNFIFSKPGMEPPSGGGCGTGGGCGSGGCGGGSCGS